MIELNTSGMSGTTGYAWHLIFLRSTKYHYNSYYLFTKATMTFSSPSGNILDQYYCCTWIIVFNFYNNVYLLFILGFRVAVLQLTVTADKSTNVAIAVKRIQKAKVNGCTLAILPECFNSPYDTGIILNHSK